MASGPSHFAVSFYKINWNILKQLVIQIIHKIPTDNCHPQSQLYGIITVIPKAEKDFLHIKYWRPLTLL